MKLSNNPFSINFPLMEKPGQHFASKNQLPGFYKRGTYHIIYDWVFLIALAASSSKLFSQKSFIIDVWLNPKYSFVKDEDIFKKWKLWKILGFRLKILHAFFWTIYYSKILSNHYKKSIHSYENHFKQISLIFLFLRFLNLAAEFCRPQNSWGFVWGSEVCKLQVKGSYRWQETLFVFCEFITAGTRIFRFSVCKPLRKNEFCSKGFL